MRASNMSTVARAVRRTGMSSPWTDIAATLSLLQPHGCDLYLDDVGRQFSYAAQRIRNEAAALSLLEQPQAKLVVARARCCQPGLRAHAGELCHAIHAFQR